ncbi:MAG: sarcosine oxidase subunit gamma [Streptosporangiales bacterium]|nr:sarcosine oxidase subunit gamma [Streptosporangiales bacterium]
MTADVKERRRRSPLDALARDLAATGGPGSVTFTEWPFRVQVELRVARDGDLGGLEDVLGLALPERVGAFAVAGERQASCLGPRWWLVTDVPEPDVRLECALAGELRASGGEDVSAVDVSAQRTTIDVAGPHARDVLAHGCSLDLHPREFAPGRCAQTMLAKAQVVLQQLDDVPTYRLAVRASFADYLGRWLLDAATEYVR